MKTITAILALSVILLLGCPLFLTADSPQDVLPLGPSKYKLVIDKVQQDQITNANTGKTVTIEDIVAQTPKTDVYIIGEAHDNYLCHTFQRDFIEALFKKHPKIVVGFEFFWREDNPALEEWRQGKLTEAQLLEKVNWYERGNQPYGYTRLIMDVIKEHKIKVIGLNVPRKILRTVSRKGFANLSQEEKDLFPTLNIPNPEHEFLIKSVFGVFAAQVPMWFTNIYTAQKCWDVIMAESMRIALAKKEFKGHKGVIIAGANHVIYRLGIPFRYAKADRRARLTTITPVLLPKEGEEDEDEEAHPMMKMFAASQKPAVLYSRGIADYVFAAPQPKYHVFPIIGLSVKDQNGKLTVTRVKKKSIAEEFGIRKGDVVTQFDGVDVTTPGQFRTLLAAKGWDDSFTVQVTKKVEIKKDEDDEEKKEDDKKEV